MQQVSGRAVRGYVMIALAVLILVPLAARFLPTGPPDVPSRISYRNRPRTTSHSLALQAAPDAVSAPAQTPAATPVSTPRGDGDKLRSSRHWRISAGQQARSLEEIRDNWKNVGARMAEELDKALPPPGKSDTHRLSILLSRASVYNFEGEPKQAYDLLAETRSWVEQNEALSEFGLYTVIFFQGVAALRLGETENCVMCRGESSCIVPIAPAAVHTNPTGSRLAIRHFTEYLEQFPDDLGVRWLLNIAHMTLGEYPAEGRSPVPDLAGPLRQIRVRHRQVPRHRPPGGSRPLQHGRRRGHGRFRQRRPARPRRHVTSIPPRPWPSTTTRATAPSRTAPRRPG